MTGVQTCALPILPATLLITLDAISRDRGAGVEKVKAPAVVVVPVSTSVTVAVE